MMIEQVRSYFAPPIFDDDDKTRVAGILNKILVLIIAILPISAIATFVFQQAFLSPLLTAVGSFVFLFVCRSLLLRGYVRASVILFCGTMFAGSTIFLASFATLQIVQISIYLLPMVIAALLLGYRAGLFFYGLSIVTLLGIYQLGLSGISGQSPPLQGYFQFSPYVFVGFVIFIVLDLFRREQRKYLERAQAGEQAQASALNELTAVFESLEKRTRFFDTALELNRQLSTILDEEELVRVIVDQLQEQFGYYHAHIYFFSDDREYLELIGGTGVVGQALRNAGHRIKSGDGLVGRTAKSNVTTWVEDVSLDDGWASNPLLPDTRTEIVAPISIGENVLGVLNVQVDEIGSLDQIDADMLDTVATQAAVVLQNARLFSQLQENAERQALINIIGQRIRETDTIDSAMRIAVREIGRALGTDQTAVYLDVTSDAQRE